MLAGTKFPTCDLPIKISFASQPLFLLQSFWNPGRQSAHNPKCIWFFLDEILFFWWFCKHLEIINMRRTLGFPLASKQHWYLNPFQHWKFRSSLPSKNYLGPLFEWELVFPTWSGPLRRVQIRGKRRDSNPRPVNHGACALPLSCHSRMVSIL